MKKYISFMLFLFVLSFLVYASPNIIFSSPTLQNNSSTNSNWSFINISSSDNLSQSFLEWGNSTGFTNVTMINVSGMTNWYANMTNLTDGTYNYTVFAQNTTGNWNQSDRRYITIDTISPIPSFTNPTPNNNTNRSVNWIYLNISLNETNIPISNFTNGNFEGSPPNNWTNSTTGGFGGQYSTIQSTGYGINNVWAYFNANGHSDYGGYYPVNALWSQTISVNSNVNYSLSFTYDALPYPTNYCQGTIYAVARVDGVDKWTDCVNSVTPTIYFTSTSNSVTIQFGVFAQYWLGTEYLNATFSNVHISTNNVLINWNGTNQTIGCTGTTFNYVCGLNKTGQIDGVYNYYSWVNDTAGNSNQTGIQTLTIDTTKPFIQINLPVNTTYNSVSRMLNYTTNDDTSGVNAIWYSYNGTNTTLSGNTTFTALNNQQSNITLYANDSAGNINSTSVFFSVDASAPTYTNLSVNSTNIRKNDTLKFSAYWNDLFAGLSKYIFSWNVTGTWVNTTYDFSGNWSNITVNMTANKTQEIAYIIYANDTYNNTNATIQASFIVNNTPPVVTASIIPSPTDGSSDLNCSYSYYDLDGDLENTSYFQWYKNNVLLNAINSTLAKSNFTNNDNIICSVRSFDSTDNSTWTNSSQLTINDNIAPVYNSITFSATSGTVNTPFTVTVNLSEANSMGFSKMEVQDPNQQLSNLTMSDSRIGSIYTYSVSYTPIIAGTYLFKFYAMDGSGNAANYTSSVSYTALTAQQQQTGGGGGITIVTQCGNRICEINENSASCPTDCAAKFTLLEPQFDRELKQITIKGGLFGGNIYEFRIKNLQDTDLNVTFRTGTVWLKFDIGGIERSEFTSKLNRKGATDSGMGYIRLVAHLVGNSSNATLGEITATDGYTTASIPVLFAASESPDYSKYATLPNIGLSLMLLIGFVFFAKKN